MVDVEQDKLVVKSQERRSWSAENISLTYPYLGIVIVVGFVRVGVGLRLVGLLHRLRVRGPQVDREVDELGVLLDQVADRVGLQVVGRLLLDVQPAEQTRLAMSAARQAGGAGRGGTGRDGAGRDEAGRGGART